MNAKCIGINIPSNTFFNLFTPSSPTVCDVVSKTESKNFVNVLFILSS